MGHLRDDILILLFPIRIVRESHGAVKNEPCGAIICVQVSGFIMMQSAAHLRLLHSVPDKCCMWWPGVRIGERRSVLRLLELTTDWVARNNRNLFPSGFLQSEIRVSAELDPSGGSEAKCVPCLSPDSRCCSPFLAFLGWWWRRSTRPVSLPGLASELPPP